MDEQKVLDLAERHLVGIDLTDPKVIHGLVEFVQALRPPEYVLVPRQPWPGVIDHFRWKNLGDGYRCMIEEVSQYQVNTLLDS